MRDSSFVSREAVDETGSVETATDNQSGIFALESHLRDYLARNLTSIANFGVPLSVFKSDDGRDGVEFQTDVGPIDLLAITPAGDFYVFELKLGRGPDAALGQILRYMGWVANHVARDRNVYGVILAADISKKLRYAVTQVPHVSLLEYELRFVVKPISSYGV